MSNEVARKKADSQPAISIRMARGNATPTMRAAHSKFWQKLISECQRELQDEGEAKK